MRLQLLILIEEHEQEIEISLTFGILVLICVYILNVLDPLPPVSHPKLEFSIINWTIQKLIGKPERFA